MLKREIINLIITSRFNRLPVTKLNRMVKPALEALWAECEEQEALAHRQNLARVADAILRESAGKLHANDKQNQRKLRKLMGRTRYPHPALIRRAEARL